MSEPALAGAKIDSAKPDQTGMFGRDGMGEVDILRPFQGRLVDRPKTLAFGHIAVRGIATVQMTAKVTSDATRPPALLPDAMVNLLAEPNVGAMCKWAAEAPLA